MKKFTGAMTALLVGAIGVVGIATPAQASIDSGERQSYTDSRGVKSWYHVYTDGVNWDRDVGVLYYFDGDYFSESPQYSQIMKPKGDVLTSIARDANDKNLAFIAVKTPSDKTTSSGFTWWEKGDSNAKWFQEFAVDMQKKGDLDTDHTWLAGYSGGAEFISFDLLTGDRSDWITDGGAALIAGGGSGSSTVPSGVHSGLDLTWYAGANDGPGQTNPPKWSALGAAEKGSATYKNAGYSNATLEVLPGVGHHDYDLAALVNRTTEAVPVDLPEPEPTATAKPEPTEEPEPTVVPEPEPTVVPEPEPTVEPEPEPEPSETEVEEEEVVEPVVEETPEPEAEKTEESESVKIDSGNPATTVIWVSIMGIVLAGAAVGGFFWYRKRQG